MSQFNQGQHQPSEFQSPVTKIDEETILEIDYNTEMKMEETFDKLMNQIKSKMDSNQLFALIMIPGYEQKFLSNFKMIPDSLLLKGQIIDKQIQTILKYLSNYGQCELDKQYLKRNDLKFYLNLTEYSTTHSMKIQEDFSKLEQEIKKSISCRCSIKFGSSISILNLLTNNYQDNKQCSIGFYQIYEQIGSMKAIILPEMGKKKEPILDELKIETIDQFRKKALQFFIKCNEQKDFFKMLNAAYGVDYFECLEQNELIQKRNQIKKQQKNYKSLVQDNRQLLNENNFIDMLREFSQIDNLIKQNQNQNEKQQIKQFESQQKNQHDNNEDDEQIIKKMRIEKQDVQIEKQNQNNIDNKNMQSQSQVQNRQRLKIKWKYHTVLKPNN